MANLIEIIINNLYVFLFFYVFFFLLLTFYDFWNRVIKRKGDNHDRTGRTD